MLNEQIIPYLYPNVFLEYHSGKEKNSEIIISEFQKELFYENYPVKVLFVF
jgi:hypothetical protein